MNDTLRRLLSSLLLCLCTLTAAAQTRTVRQRIAHLLREKHATVGVAVLTDDGVRIRCNDRRRYPLMSVFKLHVALALLDRMEREQISLDSLIRIEASQLLPDTYSPLRDRYGCREITLPLRELLRYSLSLSDNNACDILIGLAGGIDSVSGYLRRIGARGFALSQTEEDMHRDIRNSYKNRSRPSATVLLLHRALEGSLLRPDHRDFLRDCLIATSTGPDKLKGMLPEGTVIAHKTGSSDRTAQGVKIADNDVGMILLPDGRRCFVAVLIKDSQQSDAENAALIARIARIVYDGLNGRESVPPPPSRRK
ncbi:MAG: class A beta-lactamase, subclass A2 [Alistipes sp.]|nr:class A beta-lactamase, subclass A2 [Alistipes sp.]